MKFSDQDLSAYMAEALIEANVMSKAQLAELLDDPTEENVSEGLKAVAQLTAKFDAYWTLVGTWLSSHEGDIAKTSGVSVPGRDAGDPKKIYEKAIYNDAFHDVFKYKGTQQFKVNKAISNHLRFISVMNE